MKICDLALFDQASSSGVKTYITSKIRYVGRRPHLDHVVIVPGAADSVRIEGRSKVISVRGVPSPYPGVFLGVNLVRIARLVEEEAPDVIELNCQYTLPWAAFLATRRSRTPIVGVYHTDVPACARHWARHAGPVVAAAVERLVEFYEGLIYRHCTLTIALNDNMSDRIARLGVRRVRCIPCGVDPETFHPGRRDPRFRERLGISPDQTVIFYAGRLSPEKELDVLFAAFDRLARGTFVLVVAGDGPDASAAAAYAAARPDVRCIGHVESRTDLATAYASADLFVTPGRYETFGMATLEAICSGLPVVGIEGSATASVVPPEGGRMVRAGDAAALADAIVEIATWDAAATREACHRFAANRFPWDRIFDEYVAAYRELAAAPASMQEQPA
jgi:alpha-1,6-mannosyltransferase